MKNITVEEIKNKLNNHMINKLNIDPNYKYKKIEWYDDINEIEESNIYAYVFIYYGVEYEIQYNTLNDTIRTFKTNID